METSLDVWRTNRSVVDLDINTRKRVNNPEIAHLEMEFKRMNRVSSFALGLMVGVLGLYITMHFSLVRARDGYHVIPKIAAKVDVPYADIRNFTLENWLRKQSLALAILKANKGHLLQDQSLIGFRQSTQRTLDQFLSAANPRVGG